MGVLLQPLMDYNHSRKAGNRGDVWKHAILMMIADTIPIRNDEFHWLEAQAGAPIHRLQAGGEWQRGIGAIVNAKNLAYVARAAALFATENIRRGGCSRLNGCGIGVSVSLSRHAITRPPLRKPTSNFERQQA
jgi:hypothetical protein